MSKEHLLTARFGCVFAASNGAMYRYVFDHFSAARSASLAAVTAATQSACVFVPDTTLSIVKHMASLMLTPSTGSVAAKLPRAAYAPLS